MKTEAKDIIKAILPPVFPEIYHLLKSKLNPSQYGWYGNYESWEQAQNNSEGYDSDLILLKVKESLLKVKNGEAVYERDSVIFNEIEYSWPLLASIMWIAAQNKGNLNIIDFGGSLGSSYFQNRVFLNEIHSLRWNIIEQKAFILCGKENFENQNLKFFESIKDCLRETSPQAILFSSVLQYLPDPYEILKDIFSYGFEYVIFDLMPFNNKGVDRLTVQKVNPAIYKASYPCWILDKDKLLRFMSAEYELVAPFDSKLTIELDRRPIVYEGFLFKKRLNRKQS